MWQGSLGFCEEAGCRESEPHLLPLARAQLGLAGGLGRCVDFVLGWPRLPAPRVGRSPWLQTATWSLSLKGPESKGLDLS